MICARTHSTSRAIIMAIHSGFTNLSLFKNSCSIRQHGEVTGLLHNRRSHFRCTCIRDCDVLRGSIRRVFLLDPAQHSSFYSRVILHISPSAEPAISCHPNQPNAMRLLALLAIAPSSPQLSKPKVKEKAKATLEHDEDDENDLPPELEPSARLSSAG